MLQAYNVDPDTITFKRNCLLVLSPSLIQQYQNVRDQTTRLCKNLSAEDMVVQSMPDASPAKWHLAHTTWFFETFILCAHVPNYRVFNESFPFLFNSYYESAGERYLRPQRGFLTRPSLDEVIAYRQAVDDAMISLLRDKQELVNELTTVGLHHEMQHQELLLTDILHLFAHNPSHPAMFEPKALKVPSDETPLKMIPIEGSMVQVGAGSTSFSYDCERPLHEAYISPCALANRLVTNRDWLAFIDDGGYKSPLLWLSDGWATRNKQGWNTPAYWYEDEGQWCQFGLDGLRPLDLNAPVCHVSFYEADAFARWAGKRLPREHELERAASMQSIRGNFSESEYWRPRAAEVVVAADDPSIMESSLGITQLYGDVWEWTQSPYAAYPGFKAEQGALGEYNGKFMINQLVLKGGSCATPLAQMRASYRNFFYPHHRWQFTGLRLAEDQ